MMGRTLWQSPVPWMQKFLGWISDNLSEVWLFSTAVYILWHPAFPERLQNTVAVVGLMSVASALVRMKKIERKLDEMRTTQLIESGKPKQ